ncbi:hypothetical protein CVIRNUC_003893 [Coccomyxa viridis]|uniref:Uncharacterized protein n=1 Tax=Coccomyxa viridis TaxID=1274662 RepID=A0AAV1I4D0_9CHLO|nr:hypothetical protein CVIRNUC_003893 [Coccomyxa viridis]
MELMSSIERSMPTEGIPVCTTHEIRHEVEAFLASLSLGITRRDADLEDAIADKLHSLFHDCANLQHKLNQWVAVAMGLQEVIQQQEHPKHVQLSPDQADAVTGQLPSGHALEAAMAAQHREVAALQAQMAMLSHDMTALRQSSSASRAPQLPSFKQVAAEYKDLQRLHDEAASLRHALQDAELEMQRMTDTHRRELEDAAKREQAERARAAAEVLAAQHQATVLRAKLQQHAASPGSLHALPSLQATAGGAMPEGHDVVASLRVKRQELLEEVSKMQAGRCTCHIPQLFLT